MLTNTIKSMNMKQFSLSLSFVLLLNMLWAVEIKNVNSQQEGENIRVNYEIVDANPLQQYEVFLFYTLDGKENAQALKEVAGDIGGAVIGGGSKTILWNPTKEIGSLNGKVKFKVVANPTKLFTTTTGNLDGMKVTAQNCIQVGEKITVDLVFDNQKEDKMFDLYTNYIKATDNLDRELYAVNYIKGGDKVTTKRPVSIKKGQKMTITVTFEALDSTTSLFKVLELETKFPNDFMMIKNIPVNK